MENASLDHRFIASASAGREEDTVSLSLSLTNTACTHDFAFKNHCLEYHTRTTRAFSHLMHSRIAASHGR